MKTVWRMLAAGVFLTGLAAFGQSAGQAPPAQGGGRTGPPYAGGDANGDGICDITGRLVGQGRGRMCRGRRSGPRQGKGMCCRGAAATPAPAPAPAK
jgi:hypothetical protein